MAEKNQEELFAEVAVALGMLSAQQVEECRRLAKELQGKGLTSRGMSEIALEKKYLTRDQYRQVYLELRKRGVYPRIGGYELIRKVGAGAMGVVYEGRQVSLDRTVALKILSRELSKDAVFVERFEREAKLAARLTHPNAVHVYNVGQDRGMHFIVMEYVDGQPLDSLLEEGSLDERRALQITHDVAKALSEAHANSVVHRDIKPSNILIRADGIAKLSDLGIAKELGGTTAATLTGTGSTVGTPRYMSPEQCSGQQDVDGRADIYSLGITLYRMVCGQDPYCGPTPMTVMQQHVSEPLPDPKAANPSLSDGIVRLIRDMTQKDREARLQNCDEVVARIEEIMGSKSAAVTPSLRAAASAQPPEPPPPAHASWFSRRKVFVVTVGGIIVAGAVVLLAINSWNPKQPQLPPPTPLPRAKPSAPGASEEERYSNLMIEAMDAENAKNWAKALELYGKARALTMDAGQVDRAIGRVRVASEQDQFQKEYDSYLGKGKEFARQEKWPEAKDAYEKARAAADKLSAKPAGYQDLQARVEEAKAAIEGATERMKVLATYRSELERASKLSQEGKWTEAKTAYANAKSAGERLASRPAGFETLAEMMAECDRRLAPGTQPGGQGKPPEAAFNVDFSRAENTDQVAACCVAFSPASALLACGRANNSVSLWNLRTGQQATVLWRPKGSGPSKSITSLAFSPDGQLLAGTGDGLPEVWLWNVASGRGTVLKAGQAGVPYSPQRGGVAFSPNGALLAGWGNPGKLWDVKTTKLLAEPSGGGFVDYVAFCRDGRLLTAEVDTTTGQHIVCILNLQTGKTLTRFEAAGLPLAWHSDGQWLAYETVAGQISFRDLAKGSTTTVPPPGSGMSRPGAKLLGLAFHPRQPLLASIHEDGQIVMWHLPEGKPVSSMRIPQGCNRLRMSFSAEGNWLASCCENTARVDLWDVEKKAVALSLVTVGQGKDYMAWTPEGYYIGTPAVEALLRAKRGDRQLTLEELKVIFNRQDLVAAKLAGKDVPAPSEAAKDAAAEKGKTPR